MEVVSEPLERDLVQQRPSIFQYGLIAGSLFTFTLLLFSPAWKNGFVDWDDDQYVYKQPRVLSGLNGSGIAWAINANVCNNWHPLTVMSLQLDASLFGPDAFGFHRTNVLLHAINAVLAFFAIYELTRCCWKSAIVAILFAIHPLRVESVAWISERKDLVSGLFFFLALIAYSRYTKSPSWLRYCLVAMCLGLGLCAKSMLVTTPCILLLLDYWPLGYRRQLIKDPYSRFWRLLLEKLPLLVLSAAISVVTVYSQASVMHELTKLPYRDRCENMVRGTAAYLRQTIWPTDLSHLYLFPNLSIVAFVVSAAVLAAITLFVYRQRNQQPFLLVGWLWFIGVLVPVSGLIQVGIQQRADRYTYLPHVGLFLAVVWWTEALSSKTRWRKALSVCVLIAVVVQWSDLTVRQIAIWHDSQTLWSNALEKDANNRPAIMRLTTYAFQRGDNAEALKLAESALLLDGRNNRESLLSLSEIAAENNEFEFAIRAVSKAIYLPADAWRSDGELYLYRAESYGALGRWEDAVTDYRKVVEITSPYSPFQFCLAHALMNSGQTPEADRIMADVLKKTPQWAERAATAASSISKSLQPDRKKRYVAVCLAEVANHVTGGKNPIYLDTLAATYAANGQFEEAIDKAEQAIEQAEEKHQTAYASEVRSRLELYKQGQTAASSPD